MTKTKTKTKPFTTYVVNAQHFNISLEGVDRVQLEYDRPIIVGDTQVNFVIWIDMMDLASMLAMMASAVRHDIESRAQDNEEEEN
jgi:hypothetical protein